MGKTGIPVSALGFGCMRLPTVQGGTVDEELAVAMMRTAIDNGVNYFDTAYVYHSGQSEAVLGRALDNGYRDRVSIATKMPTWSVTQASDFDRFFEEQCERLHTDRIDFYLLHNLSQERWALLKNLNIARWAEKAKQQGRIGFFGFSFHHSFDIFKQFIDSYDWDFCQIQYNYMNEDVQAGTRGLQYAAKKDMAVVIMEPLLGGNLANPPGPVRRIFESSPVKRTPADHALQWLWNKPEISLVLSGMSAMDQVTQNIESAGRSGVGTMTEENLRIIDLARTEYRKLSAISCTKCAYCMPCPNGVDIPRNLELYNEGIMYNNFGLSKGLYTTVFPASIRAEQCTACRSCEEKCPQHIAISSWLAKIHQTLTGA